VTGPDSGRGGAGGTAWIRSGDDSGRDGHRGTAGSIDDLRNRSDDFLANQIAGGKEAIEAHAGRADVAYPSGADAAVSARLRLGRL
jgi:hypothetical protein